MYKFKEMIPSYIEYVMLDKPKHDAGMNDLYPDITDVFDVVPIKKKSNERYHFKKVYPQLFREYNSKSTACLIREAYANKRKDIAEIIMYLYHFRGVNIRRVMRND